MTPGLAALKHVVVLMMENRSFDHMLGALNGVNAVNGGGGIDGLTGVETNPDINGAAVKVAPKAQYQGQLDPDPDHHFTAVHKQIFNGGSTASMQGFVRSYYDQQRDIKQSQKVMYYFAPDKLPVLTNLAREFAVFNRWFASIPGPTLCNRAFAHYGTSFGNVSMELFYAGQQYKSIFERLTAAQISSRVYYFDTASSTLEVPNLLNNQPQLFGTFSQFVSDCANDRLPAYSFVEPNYTDHEDSSGAMWIASDQHPDHHVREGEAEPRALAQVRAAGRLRRARRPLRPRRPAGSDYGRLRGATGRNRHGRGVSFRSPRCARAGRPDFALDPERHGRQRTRLRARIDPRDDHRLADWPAERSIAQGEGRGDVSRSADRAGPARRLH
jgi:phosphoesterase family protein